MSVTHRSEAQTQSLLVAGVLIHARSINREAEGARDSLEYHRENHRMNHSKELGKTNIINEIVYVIADYIAR